MIDVLRVQANPTERELQECGWQLEPRWMELVYEGSSSEESASSDPDHKEWDYPSGEESGEDELPGDDYLFHYQRPKKRSSSPDTNEYDLSNTSSDVPDRHPSDDGTDDRGHDHGGDVHDY